MIVTKGLRCRSSTKSPGTKGEKSSDALSATGGSFQSAADGASSAGGVVSDSSDPVGGSEYSEAPDSITDSSIGALFSLGPRSRLDEAGLGQALVIPAIALDIRRPTASDSPGSASGSPCTSWPEAGSPPEPHSEAHRPPRPIGILMPAVLARRATNLTALRRYCAVLHHILRSAIGAGEDHGDKWPLAVDERTVNRNDTGLARRPVR